MKNKIYITIASVILILMQMTFCNWIKVYGIKPNLVLVFIIILGFYGKKSELFFCGVFCGLLQDILLSKSIGVYLFINLLFCMIIENIRRHEFSFLKVFVFSLVYDGLVFMFCSFPSTLKELLFVFYRLIFCGALYNTICFAIVFAIMNRKRKIGNL